MNEKKCEGMMRMKLRGMWVVEHVRDGKVLGRYEFPNGIVDVGMNYLLTAGFNAGSQITTWYIGLIDSASYSALDHADTMGTHSGWIECTTYTEETHPEWTCGNADARAITNASTVDFTLNASKTLKGVYITSVNTKGSGSGTLWSTALFSSPIVVNNGDVLKLTYTVSGS